jgi:Zn-dependent M28 family amino/carboxypeptidase
MFGSEEQGGSSGAYLAAHKAEVGKMIVTGESDEGPGPIWILNLPKGSAGHPAMGAFLTAIGPLKVIADREPSSLGGADIQGLMAAGVPVVDLLPDANRYFDLHHSADDTLDKINPADLAQSTAVWTAFIYTVANSDIDFRKLAAAVPAAPAR